MEMFKPELSLAQEPDGEFTLFATTNTPNSCFSWGFVTDGTPPGHTVVTTAKAVTLNVIHRNGICLQVVTPIKHVVPNIRLGGDSGHTSVIAFVVLDHGAGGTVVGQNSIGLGDTAAIAVLSGGARDAAVSSDWTAIADLRPPPPGSLFVRGSVSVPNPGCLGTIAPAVPQEGNPGQLVLDLRLSQQPGMWPQVVTQIEVAYRDGNYSGMHDTVAIRFPDGGQQVIGIRNLS
ncbi:hypothetical protein [Mesorhizobium sp. BR1-1-14]|uniref:hypothetical protein n=1 Tax=Mesorhizobium sp. BR1-1-14 TaxID=2876655 RepID=UPI001CD0DF11|nr:hypothetical protein [Mesorhizobium sp. BR1-1-14]MBZ9959316.1 hypothetical protein [Mesorhizobium sp. BR1-1-14]